MTLPDQTKADRKAAAEAGDVDRAFITTQYGRRKRPTGIRLMASAIFTLLASPFVLIYNLFHRSKPTTPLPGTTKDQ